MIVPFEFSTLLVALVWDGRLEDGTDEEQPLWWWNTINE